MPWEEQMLDARVRLLGLANNIVEVVGAVRGGDINSKHKSGLWLSSENTTLEVGDVLILANSEDRLFYFVCRSAVGFIG